MKTKKFIIKPVALFLAIILMMFTFSSCGYKPEPPEENAFELIMDFSETMVKKGSTVTYRAILKNNEHESYTLKYADDLINIYVVKPENYIEPKDHIALSDAVVSEGGIAAHGQVENFYDFTPTERGKYILKAYSQFTIEGKESTKDYLYECEEIEITVY